MNNARMVLCAALLASAFLMSPTHAASNSQLDQVMSVGGLQKIKVRDIEVAYARPGASLAGYNSVRLDPVEVAFRKDWEPTRTGSRFKLTAEERESIRTGVAKIVGEEFAKELQAKSGYKVVDEAGPGVLRVKVRIVNLYANAPDTGSMGPSRTYVVSAGEMTLVAELFDSESGEVLARVADRREARNTGRLQLSSRNVNAQEAAAIASTWARILRKALDRAHGIGGR